jgi:TPR repeat protein
MVSYPLPKRTQNSHKAIWYKTTGSLTGAELRATGMSTQRWITTNACAALCSLAIAPPAVSETGSSGWLQRTKPAAITRSARPKRRRATVAGRVKSQVVPKLRPGITQPQLDKFKRPAKSTLGPIMAEPTGDNAAYIAFDQSQYLTAKRLAEKAAEGGQPQAFTLLGRLYEMGLGVTKNELMAARMYRRGAELGDTESMFSFAVMLATGRGIQKNIKGAAQLFEKAARAGHPEANYNLGLMFISGNGKPENPRRALMHFQYAAKKGIAAARYDLAALYRTGRGTEPDAYKATTWLRAAAKSGMAAAQYEYAVAILQGRGFNRDKPDIVDYLISAARQGIPGAQNRLAHIYAEGRLVRRNMIEAAKWRLIAKASGRETARFDKVLDSQIAKMSRAERQKARLAADGFVEGSRVGNVIAASQKR